MRFVLVAIAFYLFASFAGQAEPASSVDRVYILGEVRKPGAVKLTESTMTVFDVIAQCGGLTKRGDATKVHLIHHLPGLKSRITIINLWPYLHDSTVPASSESSAQKPIFNPVVEPGDVIDVPQVLFKD